MKKNTMLLIACLFIGISYSCQKKESITGPLSKVLRSDEDNANDIVSFNNKFLAIYKDRTRTIDAVIKYAEAAYKKTLGADVLVMPMVVPGVEMAINKIDKVPDAYGDKTSIVISDFKTFNEKNAAINKAYQELKSYITAENYKEDKGTEAKLLLDQITSDGKAFFTAAENILATIKPATEAAEELTLKDHPLKPYIMSSKKVLNSIDDSFVIIEKQYNDGKFSELETQKSYDEITALLLASTNLKFEIKEPKYSVKSITYDRLNKDVSNYLALYKKLIQDGKSTGAIPESDITEMDDSYNTVIASYNALVN